MRIENLKDTGVRINGREIEANPVPTLPADVYDAMIFAAETVGGVSEGKAFEGDGVPCCPWGVASFVDGADDVYFIERPGPCLTALAKTGLNYPYFDNAVRALGGDNETRVPLFYVFNYLGITRGDE